ncbi:MAG: hypothetical protein ACJ77M_00835, partial [Thermoleophilaceae bacterium]
MSEAAVSLAFFDTAQGLHGSARSGVTLLFEHSAPRTLPDGASIARDGDAWRASVDGELDLKFTPLSEPAELDGSRTRICQVAGTIGSAQLECLGTATETDTPPEWAELDAIRAVS